MELNTLDGALDDAKRILITALEEHQPVKVWAMLSGGNDSTAMTLVAKQILGDKLDGVVFINTGTGIPQTLKFVKEFSEWANLPLLEMYPPAKTYEEIVLESGFPGPAAHRYMYSWLKERAIRKLVRESKRPDKKFDRVMLITGVRTAESTRRMGNVSEIQRDGAKLWVAPIANWKKNHIWEFRERYKMPENEVSALLHYSGECLCGAFARPGELEEIRVFYPEVAERIEKLQDKVKAAGHPRYTWGNNPKEKASEAGPLCSDCAHRPGVTTDNT